VIAAAALAGLGVAGGVAAPASAGPPVPTLPRRETPFRFELDGDPHRLFANARMYGGDYYLQSFSFDTQNRRLFLAQLHKPAAGEPAVDLNIVQMSMTGKVQSRMSLLGFGHGVAIAAVPEGGSTYIWVEINPNASGWGSQLARLKYVPGTTIDSSDIRSGQDITVFTPVAGAGAFTAAVDPLTDRLVIRYNDVDGVRGPAHAIRFTTFPLSAACAGKFDDPVFDIVQPKLPAGSDGKAPTFQGFTAAGNFLYLLDGTAYPDHIPDRTKINSYLTAVDLRSGGIVQRSRTRAGASLDLREPEGMAIDIGPDQRPRLCFGFCTLTEVDSTVYRASIFFDRTAVPRDG